MRPRWVNGYKRLGILDTPWDLKITCLKWKTIFQTFIFGFHVNFQGCICLKQKIRRNFGGFLAGGGRKRYKNAGKLEDFQKKDDPPTHFPRLLGNKAYKDIHIYLYIYIHTHLTLEDFNKKKVDPPTQTISPTKFQSTTTPQVMKQ